MPLQTGNPRYVDIYTIYVDNCTLGWTESFETVCQALQGLESFKKEIRITKQKRLLQ